MGAYLVLRAFESERGITEREESPRQAQRHQATIETADDDEGRDKVVPDALVSLCTTTSANCLLLSRRSLADVCRRRPCYS